jgi:hypothetical protein
VKQKKIKKGKRKEKCSIVFLKFYVDGAWNKKKLSIGVLKDEKFVCLDEISCFNKKLFFIECSTSFGFSLFFSLFLPHLNFNPITTKK